MAVFRYQSVIATLCTFFVLAGVIAKIAPAPKTAPAGNWLTDLGDKRRPGPRRAAARSPSRWSIWFAAVADGVSPQPLRRRRQRRDRVQRRHRTSPPTRIIAYALGGAFAAVAGVALTALVQSTQASGFAQYTLIALAAVALGGTQLGGGRGGLVGVPARRAAAST